MQVAQAQCLLQLCCIQLPAAVGVYGIKPCAQLLLLGVHFLFLLLLLLLGLLWFRCCCCISMHYCSLLLLVSSPLKVLH